MPDPEPERRTNAPPGPSACSAVSRPSRRKRNQPHLARAAKLPADGWQRLFSKKTR